MNQAAGQHIEKAVPPEKSFRWRAGEITRLEAFCDVVFGFAITLLVVSLEVPKSYAELMTDIRGFVPFAVCFAQLILIWKTHYQFSRRYGLEDGYTLLLNLVLLFLVLFYVYPLKFLFTALLGGMHGGSEVGISGPHQASVLMRVYGLGFAAVFLLFVLMYLHAYKLRGKLELNSLEVHETRTSLQENAILASVGMISFWIAFWNPAVAGWTYASLGVLLWGHGIYMGRKRRLFEKK